MGGQNWGKVRDEVVGDGKKQELSFELAEMAHESFMRYRSAVTNSVDSHKLVQLLRYCGCPTDEKDAQAQMWKQEIYDGGGVGHREFLGIFESIIAEGRDVHEPLSKALSSLYGRSARMRWIKSDGEYILNGDVTGELVPVRRRLARLLVLSTHLELFCYGSITVSAVVAGLETSPAFTGPTLTLVGHLTNGIFALEVILKMTAESQNLSTLLAFHSDSWNAFDVSVLTMLVFAMTGFSGLESLVALRVLRFMRAAQAFRAARMMPQMAVVMETIEHSSEKVTPIVILLAMVMYVFAIIGVSVFGGNDPFHFGHIGSAMVTLFRVATMDGWPEVLCVLCDNEFRWCLTHM